MNKGILATIIAVVSVAPSSVAAQNGYYQVHDYIRYYDNSHFAPRGYTKTHDTWVSTLTDGRYESFTVNLTAGVENKLVGVCDNYCSDVDLRIYDGSGTLIDSDILGDDTPLISVTVVGSGAFIVRVSMVTCYSSPCTYAVGVFGRRAWEDLDDTIPSQLRNDNE